MEIIHAMYEKRNKMQMFSFPASLSIRVQLNDNLIDYSYYYNTKTMSNIQVINEKTGYNKYYDLNSIPKKYQKEIGILNKIKDTIDVDALDVMLEMINEKQVDLIEYGTLKEYGFDLVC